MFEIINSWWKLKHVKVLLQYTYFCYGLFVAIVNEKVPQICHSNNQGEPDYAP